MLSVEQRRAYANRSQLQAPRTTIHPMDSFATKSRPSLRELNYQKQRAARLEAQQYTGLAANMVRSPLRHHEEQKLKNDSPNRLSSSFKGLNKPPPRDFSMHPPIAEVMAPFLTPQVQSSKFGQTPGGLDGLGATPGNPYSNTPGPNVNF